MRAATRAKLARYDALDLQYHASREAPVGMREAWYAMPLLARVWFLLRQPLIDAVGEVVDAALRRPPEVRR